MLTADQLRTLAQQAQTDERTAVRWLAGLRVHRRCADQLAGAWKALGWTLNERTAWPTATIRDRACLCSKPFGEHEHGCPSLQGEHNQ